MAEESITIREILLAKDDPDQLQDLIRRFQAAEENKSNTDAALRMLYRSLSTTAKFFLEEALKNLKTSSDGSSSCQRFLGRCRRQ